MSSDVNGRWNGVRIKLRSLMLFMINSSYFHVEIQFCERLVQWGLILISRIRKQLTKDGIVSTNRGEPLLKDIINEGFSPGAIFADEAYFRIPKRWCEDRLGFAERYLLNKSYYLQDFPFAFQLDFPSECKTIIMAFVKRYLSWSASSQLYYSVCLK